MDDPSLKQIIITDRILRSWIRCKRKAWLDTFGDSQKKIWSHHRALQLQHQHKSFSELFLEAYGHGLEACKAGTPWVLGLRLKGYDLQGNSIEAHPPLLQRVQGQSIWGEFAYRPVLARQGKNLTREHLLLITFYGYLLEQIQQSTVNKALIVSKTQHDLDIDQISISKSLKKQLWSEVKKLREELKKAESPELTSERRKCTLCSWQKECNEIAIQQGLLSDISGVGSKRVRILREIGIFNINDLAKANVQNLQRMLGDYGVQHREIAEKIISQANCQLQGSKQRIRQNETLPELKLANGVLIYDIESDPDAREDFLHGFLIINRNKNGSWESCSTRYIPLLFEPGQSNKSCWDIINKTLETYKTWPILHYGETESITLIRLGKKNGVDDNEIQSISNRLIDIHLRVKDSWMLPIKNYGLKAMANWVGFKWTESRVDGAKALFWWRIWKSKKNSSLMSRLYQYNKDDCIATWKIAEWLLKEDGNFS